MSVALLTALAFGALVLAIAWLEGAFHHDAANSRREKARETGRRMARWAR